MTGIPHLTREREGEARRFINLVDILYENDTLLLASADFPPDRLFDLGSDQRTCDMAKKMDGVELQVTDKGGGGVGKVGGIKIQIEVAPVLRITEIVVLLLFFISFFFSFNGLHG